MTDRMFKALRVEARADDYYSISVGEQRLSDLPDQEVLIRVAYSSLNFKDALSAHGHRGVTRSYPHTPGIDAAGTVVRSRSDCVREGDEVIVTGYDLGMNTPGGFGEYICVPAGWCVPKPPGHDLRYFMSLGTAGLTAALSVDRLTRYLKPADGEVLVTGATGGVGSLAVALLSHLGFEVVATTGKVDRSDFLVRLGAGRVLERSFLDRLPDKPLLRAERAGLVDTTGGSVLSRLLGTLQHGGVATTCGMVAGTELHTSVFPFILRGITLHGIDSVEIPLAEKARMWALLDGAWNMPILGSIVQEVTLNELPTAIERIYSGKQLGRVVLRHAHHPVTDSQS